MSCAASGQVRLGNGRTRHAGTQGTWACLRAFGAGGPDLSRRARDLARPRHLRWYRAPHLRPGGRTC